MNENHNLLRLNVGFIIHESVGYSRDFEIKSEKIHLSPDLDLYKMEGNAKVTRMAHGLLLQIKMHAKAAIECSRCLDPYLQSLQIEYTDLYSFPHQVEDDSDLIVPEDGLLDLESSLREEMLVAIPINTLCRLDCKGLCPVCGENRNTNFCNHEQQSIDPRLESLKSLLE